MTNSGMFFSVKKYHGIFLEVKTRQHFHNYRFAVIFVRVDMQIIYLYNIIIKVWNKLSDDRVNLKVFIVLHLSLLFSR